MAIKFHGAFFFSFFFSICVCACYVLDGPAVISCYKNSEWGYCFKASGQADKGLVQCEKNNKMSLEKLKLQNAIKLCFMYPRGVQTCSGHLRLKGKPCSKYDGEIS